LKLAAPVALVGIVTVVALTALHITQSASGAGASPPAAPVLLSAPPNPTTVDTATFRFAAPKPGVKRFECRMGTKAYSACTSPAKTRPLGSGSHTFAVRALDSAGHAGAPRTYTWTVQAKVTSFHITGHVSTRLTPGSTAPVDLAISNPFSFPIVVRGMKVTPKRGTVTADGKPNPGCDGTAALTAKPYAGADVKVPSNTIVTLSELGIPAANWPQVTMSGDQKACVGARFEFSYSAKGAKATATKKP
jgi:hypothetical protein